MCADPDSTSWPRGIDAMIMHFADHQPVPGFAFYHAQLGICVAALAGTVDSRAANRVLVRVADEVITSGDGYAAREVLRHHDTHSPMTDGQRVALTSLLNASGLGAGTLPDPLRQAITIIRDLDRITAYTSDGHPIGYNHLDHTKHHQGTLIPAT